MPNSGSSYLHGLQGLELHSCRTGDGALLDVQILYFYIAYLNHTGDPGVLPSVPLAVLLLILSVAAAFAAVSYRAFLRQRLR